jgi:hypothetical protein
MKTSFPLIYSTAIASLGLVSAANAQVPYPNIGTPISVGDELFAQGGDVTVTFVGKGAAGYTDLLFLASPNTTPYNSSANWIFDNQTSAAGATVDLGSFAAGTELEFGMDNSIGNTFYTGPGSRNSDGDVHAYVVNDYNGDPNEQYVGFEDEPSSYSDFNYADVQFVFTGTVAAPAPDTGSTLSLFGMGLAGLAGFARRFKK